ncbi:MAG: Sec-independent protein translocase protein TatB [Gallionella sp.]|nr:Sec-independent protein translocase protein TatB [Gallionella sp.]
MFDIAFSELAIVMLVALMVIGPERLPKVARTLGHLWGRVQRYVQNVKNEISNDMVIEEARKLQQNIRQEASSIGNTLQETGLTLEQHILQAHHKAKQDEVPPTIPATAVPHASDKTDQ